MSALLIVPIVALAAYMIYRHTKSVFGESESCCGCSSREKCQKITSPKDNKVPGPDSQQVV